MTQEWTGTTPTDKEHVHRSTANITVDVRDGIFSPEVRSKAKPHPCTAAIRYSTEGLPRAQWQRKQQAEAQEGTE